MHPKRTIVAHAILAIAIAVLAGCSSNSSSPTTTQAPSTTTTSTSTTASTTSTSSAASPADASKAQTLVLVQADFPSGWSGTPHTRTADSEADDASLAACVGRPDPDTRKTATVDGQDFQLSGTNAPLPPQVRSNAVYVTSEADMRADAAAYRGSTFAGCFSDTLTKVLARTSPAATSKVTGVEPLSVPTYGDLAFGYHIAITIAAQGQSLDVSYDIVFIGKGRAELQAIFSFVGQPFDAALESSLVATLGTRVASA